MNLFEQSDASRRARLRALGWHHEPSPGGGRWFAPMRGGGHGVGLDEPEAFLALEKLEEVSEKSKSTGE